jgi:hypothetical protein
MIVASRRMRNDTRPPGRKGGRAYSMPPSSLTLARMKRFHGEGTNGMERPDASTAAQKLPVQLG